MKHKFDIGTKYLPRAKHPRICTVSDQMTVTNSAGEIVKIYYRATHTLMGQTVTEYEVCETTVAMGVARYADPKIRAKAEYTKTV